jgi:hypothetical protein
MLATKNVISFQEGADILSKLLEEKIPVHALSMWGTGSLVVLSGFVDSITDERGVVVAASSPPAEGPGFIAVRFAGRQCEFSYCDARELPAEAAEYTGKLGDTVLLVRFPESGEILGLTFRL